MVDIVLEYEVAPPMTLGQGLGKVRPDKVRIPQKNDAWPLENTECT